MALKIMVTRQSSFCPGVDRAFRITEETLFGRSGPTYSAGPLIHNPEVISRLRLLGLEVIDPRGRNLPPLKSVPVIVRSHGIDVETENRLADLGAQLVDATCPIVKRAHESARELVESGYRVLVLGSPVHPEVQSIVGRAGGPVTVVESPEEALEYLEGKGRGARRVGIVCQTTISRSLLDSVVSAVEPLVEEIEVRNTICKSVTKRRREAVRLAGRVDLMLVVGGLESSNTSHLAEICSESGVRTYHVENPGDIQPEWLEGVTRVGIAGGASTPDWQIDEAVERLKSLDSEIP